MNKIHWYLGSSSLAMIMEQDRKHWLLKTDKKKQIQDASGDEFQGRVDNMGSNIVVETGKLPYTDQIVRKASFQNTEMNEILDFQSSKFPQIPELPGLKFARLKSINLFYENTYHNFRFALKDCTVIYVPIASGTDSGDVLVYKWYRSTTPVLQLMDSNNQYTIEVPITFASGVTNPVFYYPIDDTIAPFSLHTSSTNTLCVTDPITDQDAIGYPLFWFNCDESKIGPIVQLNNDDTESTNPLCKLLTIGHAGNESDYQAYLYPATGMLSYVSPDGVAGDWEIWCSSATIPFSGTSGDLLIPIQDIRFISGNQTVQINTMNSVGNNLFYMAENTDWVYDTSTGQYHIPVSSFISNVYDEHNVLIPVFRIEMDQSLSYTERTTDIGYAGIQMMSSQLQDDQGSRYPHDIKYMDGLPSHITDDDSDVSPQQLAIYAIHNTPYYTPTDPSTRQIAGLLFDPGVEKTSSASTPFTTEEIGRVYVLSNDDITYQNNATTSTPKPARTIARICDIPTSVMQLSNLQGLAPTSVVDKKYVRSLVSYTEADKDRLYNGLRSLWVKPTHLDEDGVPIYPSDSQTNQFIFDSMEQLNRVDLMDHNDFRTLSNLNPMVDPADVVVNAITTPGSGYSVGNYGIIVIGGFSYIYHVDAVNTDGGVTEVSIAPNESQQINLANFDLYNEYDGLTKPYGTSPLGSDDQTPTGTGLKIQFRINDFNSLLVQKGDIVDGLFAFAKDSEGIWLCSYKNDIGKTNEWVQEELIASSNVSYTSNVDGTVSPVDAYMDSIIPSIRPITVSTLEPQQAELTIYGFTTATSINIIDKDTTPVRIPSNSTYTDTRTVIDINKYYSRGFKTLTANQRTVTGVIQAIKEQHMDAFDSYVLWRWVNDQRQFEFAIVRRSLDNLRSTDSTSSLPDNDLVIKRFVHTNPQTTVVWNVDHVGPMVWMYNPQSYKHEKYYVDANTRSLCVTRDEITWADVEVTDISRREKIDVVDSNGLLRYNILTNNPIHCGMPSQAKVIYQQPDYQQLSSCTIGSTPGIVPIGAWELVFPQIHTFTFTNESGSKSYSPTKMHVIRGNNLTPNHVTDESGNNVNSSTLIMSQNTDTNRVELKSYNNDTGEWDTL